MISIPPKLTTISSNRNNSWLKIRTWWPTVKSSMPQSLRKDSTVHAFRLIKQITTVRIYRSWPFPKLSIRNSLKKVSQIKAWISAWVSIKKSAQKAIWSMTPNQSKKFNFHQKSRGIFTNQHKAKLFPSKTVTSSPIHCQSTKRKSKKLVCMNQ